MPLHTARDYTPSLHDFIYVAEVNWPGSQEPQTDWIYGADKVEQWLLQYVGHKYVTWAWNPAIHYPDISVAFKYDRHRMLFLLVYT